MSLLAACLVTLLSLTSFSSNAWAFDQTQLDLLKSSVEQWNNWKFSTGSRPDLTGADLSGLNLTDAFLRFSDLSGANLAGTNLHDADLISVKLNNANLTGADLTDTSLSDTDFSGANLTNANLSGYHYTDDFINFQGANLSDANLNSDELIVCNINTDPYADRYRDPYADRYRDPYADRYRDPYADRYTDPENSYRYQFRCESSRSRESNLVVNFYQATYNENTQFPPGLDPERAVAKNNQPFDRYARYR
ncbi:pentapeptide repeat-containing protein [Planktothrix mougeotii]|uniref:Pentapeptide repeat-containing protein n=1 Tax=Planktothrix mougeotii LEGE 06226 TaxID=1828728 RepID=A0ABR9UB50_9CYAN|nr:pentapeptide repeat-containing protein [Planktothrix mougeotii]MBE9143688.1 pentapeptide repeat-containing protein [Planktothrix mougeotii LEGE 06226]